MKRYSATVRLSGLDGITTTEVRRHHLSAAEIVVLRFVHGVDSVVKIAEDVIASKKDTLSPAQEYGRLAQRYNRVDPDTEKTALQECFPGSRPALPMDLDDAGIDINNLGGDLEVNATGMEKRGRSPIKAEDLEGLVEAEKAEEIDDFEEDFSEEEEEAFELADELAQPEAAKPKKAAKGK